MLIFENLGTTDKTIARKTLSMEVVNALRPFKGKR